MRQIEKMVLLQTLDHLWREHLVTLEHLRQVIGFRSYGQRDPLNEYKSEGFHLFETMLASLREAVTGTLMHIQGAGRGGSTRCSRWSCHPCGPARRPVHRRRGDRHGGRGAASRDRPGRAAEGVRLCRRGGARAGVNPKDPATWGKVARNALCPCGSGKKYKHCHGKND